MPINLEKLIQNNGWFLASFSEVRKYGNFDYSVFKDNLGITIFIKDKCLILFDDNVSEGTKRFTIAHEMGHIVLNHKDNTINQRTRETQASMFAARLLMPMCVLNECKVKSVKEIQNMCAVSFTAASYRYDRLEMLRNRNRFYVDDMENFIYKLYKPFIKKYKKDHHKFYLLEDYYKKIINKYSSLKNS